MENLSHKKKWHTGTVKVHIDPPLIPLKKSKNNEKPDKYFIKIELRRNPTSETFDLYEFKLSLFNNRNPEEFLLFIYNFNMTI